MNNCVETDDRGHADERHKSEQCEDQRVSVRLVDVAANARSNTAEQMFDERPRMPATTPTLANDKSC